MTDTPTSDAPPSDTPRSADRTTGADAALPPPGADAPLPPPGADAPLPPPASDPAYSSRRLFGRLWRDYLSPHKFWLMAAFCSMVAEGSTLAVLSWMLKPLFDRVFVGGDSGAVWWVGGTILGLFLIRAATTIINRAILTRIAQATSTAMQTDLLRHLLTLDGRFYQDNSPGALIERVQGDTSAVQGVWATLITGVGRDIVALITLFAVAVRIDLNWTLAALVGAPLLILPIVMVQRYIRRKIFHVRTQAGLRATRLDEVFHGITAVKLYRMEDYQMTRFSRIVAGIVRAEVKSAASRATIPALIDVVTGLGFFLVLVLGGKEIAAGTRTVGDFMAFFTAMSLAFQPLRRLGDMAGTWQTAAASLTRIYTLMDARARVKGGSGSARPAGTRIRFDDVHLSYGRHPALRGLSFVAEAGQTTALVGASGAGKSTVFNLLTRLVDPDTGVITLGEVDTRSLPLDVLRDYFSTVAQDAALFDETIRENITLGQSDVSDARLTQALDAAHVSEFTNLLPAGVETPAGPRGSGLSGGQRQRVAIARAVLRNAPVLLLDEATSALDAQSERFVQEALEALAQGRTTLVIAHRLATVRNAHKIVVLDHGRVVEEGTHDSLLALDGVYARLSRMQFSE